MSLETLYADDIRANYARKVREIGPAPETSFSLWSAAGAGFAGVPGGLLEMSGSAVGGLGVAQRETARRPRPAVMQDSPAPRPEESLTGDIFRAKAAEFAPDPKTAHAADQVMYSLGRIGGKAALLLSGFGTPVGAALLAAEETNTVDQNLQAQGVDPDTAMLAALPQGLLTGVGIALPVSGAALPLTMAGKTAATVGLVGVGGPGSYIVQETIAKEVLARAGYAEEAAQRDPYDPLALTLSTVLPGAFGALAMRGAAKAARAPLKTEADVRAAVQMTPAEQAASDAFERSAGNLTELRAAIAAEKRPEAKAILEAELKTQEAAASKAGTEAVLNKAAESTEVVDAARAVVVERAMQRSLPDAPNARADVMTALDEVAAGRMPDMPPAISAAERDANFKAWFGESVVRQEDGTPMVVYHGTGRNFEAFDQGKLGDNTGVADAREGFFFTSSGRDASEYAWKDGEPGQVMPVYLNIRNPFVTDMVVTAANNREFAKVLRDAKAAGHDGVAAFLDTFGRESSVFVAFDEKQVKSATGNSGKFDPESASLTDPLPTRDHNTIPRDDAKPQDGAAVNGQASEPTMTPETTQGKPRDLKAEVIALRKTRAILTKLAECLA